MLWLEWFEQTQKQNLRISKKIKPEYFDMAQEINDENNRD